jgi:hypothetical protein
MSFNKESAENSERNHSPQIKPGFIANEKKPIIDLK